MKNKKASLDVNSTQTNQNPYSQNIRERPQQPSSGQMRSRNGMMQHAANTVGLAAKSPQQVASKIGQT